MPIRHSSSPMPMTMRAISIRCYAGRRGASMATSKRGFWWTRRRRPRIFWTRSPGSSRGPAPMTRRSCSLPGMGSPMDGSDSISFPLRRRRMLRASDPARYRNRSCAMRWARLRGRCCSSSMPAIQARRSTARYRRSMQRQWSTAFRGRKQGSSCSRPRRAGSFDRAPGMEERRLHGVVDRRARRQSGLRCGWRNHYG